MSASSIQHYGSDGVTFSTRVQAVTARWSGSSAQQPGVTARGASMAFGSEQQ